MKIYDISRDIASTPVYPGDPEPQAKRVQKIENGDMCNLSMLAMCAHNATHVDAPNHFIDDGVTMENVPLSRFIGPCTVIECDEPLTGAQIDELLPNIKKRLLIKGKGEVTKSAAFALREGGIKLVGVEYQSVGPQGDPEAVHMELLGAGVVLLEGLDLSAVDSGDYYLVAAPIKWSGLEGAPCRAILMEGIIA